jgi:chloride channel protein, CIC family
MPEALEAILVGGSRVAALKPVSAVISIGTGGPFGAEEPRSRGAEEPRIRTGGAVGSILVRQRPLTSGERKTPPVAGPAAGGSATVNTPLASILPTVEPLLYEWRPGSLMSEPRRSPWPPCAGSCAAAGRRSGCRTSRRPNRRWSGRRRRRTSPGR